MNILSNFQEQVKKYLVYFPECDSLEYFKSIIDYFKGQLFLIDLRIIYHSVETWMTIYHCKIIDFQYKEIIKDNRTIIFMIMKKPILKIFQIDHISIDNNKQISYGNAFDDRGYGLQALKVVINMTINTLETENNK